MCFDKHKRGVAAILVLLLITSMFTIPGFVQVSYAASDEAEKEETLLPKTGEVVPGEEIDGQATAGAVTLMDENWGAGDAVQGAAALTQLADLSALPEWKNYQNIGWYNEGSTSFKISSAEQLSGLAALVNDGNDFKGKTITLTSDINLSGKNWTPIGICETKYGGGDGAPFAGTFDGGGNTITGLTCHSEGANADGASGLFGYIEAPAKIHNVNLTVKDMSVEYSMHTGHAGGIVGTATGRNEKKVEISNCNILVDGMIAGRGTGIRNIGGLIGYGKYVDIKNCYVDIKKNGCIEIAGISAHGSSSYNGNVAALGGRLDDSSISKSRICISGKISLNANDAWSFMIGGLAGMASKTDITDCYIILRNGGSISTDNNIWGNALYFGGLIGYAVNNGNAKTSYIIIEEGGVLSCNEKTEKINKGILIGYTQNQRLVRCYAYGDGMDIVGDPSGIQVGSSYEKFDLLGDLKIEDNFKGFDFNNTWGLGSKDYPIFQSEEPQNIISFINQSDPLGIKRSAVFGQTLEAGGTISPAAANLTASYRWLRTTGSGSQATTTVVSKRDSYTLTKEDIGSNISLEVKGDKPYMSVLTTPTVSVTKAPCVTKAGILTGKIPSNVNATDGAIIGLNPDFRYEYRAGSTGTYTPVEQGMASIENLAAGTYQVRIVATETHLASASVTVKIPLYGEVPVQGAVSISGTPRFGQTLTADASSITPQEAQAGLSYSWFRGEDSESVTAAAIATGSAYQLKAEDIGKVITLKAEGTGAYTGSVTTTSGIIGKAETPAPNAPKVSEGGITVNSVTLVTEAGVQYRCGETGVWQDDGLFTGLNEGTPYKFYAKKAETETHEESPVSEALSVTTLKGKHSINLDKTGTVNMGSVEEGYDAAEFEKLIIEVTNIGNQPITNVATQLTGSGISAFKVDGMNLDRLEVGKTGRITVVPAENLNPGTYEATLIVTGKEGGEARVGLSFEVKKKPTIIENAQITLTAPAAGYSPQNAITAADTFTVGSTTWTKMNEPEEPAGETFDFESIYKATVTLKAKENCQFSEAVTISGIQAEGLTITNVDESGLTFEATFAPTAARPGEEATIIEDAPLILAAPGGGEAPGGASTTTEAAAAFQVISTTWTTADGQPVKDQFDYEAIYKATVLLGVKNGYAFRADTTTVSGITGPGVAVSNFNVPEGGASLQVEFTFPATDPRPGVTVSGIVMGYNAKYLPTITLSKEGVVVATASAVEVVEIAGNQFVQRSFAFTFEGIAPDTYELKAMKGGHLSVTVKNVVVGREALDLTQDSRDAVKALELPCGNLVLAASEDNDVINIADKNLIANAKNWNKKTDSADGPEEPLTDLNGDGVVNIADKNLVANLVNWNQKPVVIE